MNDEGEDMENQDEYNADEATRMQALEFAIEANKHMNLDSPDQIVNAANTFFNFIKGEKQNGH